jgi:integrase
MSSVTLQPSGKFRGYAQVKTMRDSKLFDREKDAKLWADKTEARMKSGTWVKAAAEAEGMTVKQAFELYHDSEDWYAKAEHTTRKVELTKTKPVLAALGSKGLQELLQADVEGYISQRRKVRSKRAKNEEGKLSNAQIRLEVAALSSMLNWAVDKDHVKTNVAKHVKRPVNARRKDRMPDEVMGAILEKDPIMEDLQASAFFRTLFTTGCRPGEIASAPRGWLRADPPQISLPESKNGDARTIVLPTNLYSMLLDAMAEQPDCPLIFGTKKRFSEGWGPYGYAVPWAKARQLAADNGQVPVGVQLVPYLARHEVISKLFERTNLSDGQIAAISGHRSAQALWHYRHLRNEHNRRLIDRLDDIVGDAIERAISPSHPSQPLQMGEKLTDKPARKRKALPKKSPYTTEAEWDALEAKKKPLE